MCCHSLPKILLIFVMNLS